jgi:(p)ppGpp synthase/HD superfamily hydrolase
MNVHKRETIQNPSGRVESERRWRLIMDSSESDAAFRQFREALDLRFPHKDGVPTLTLKAWEFASAINYEHGNIPARIYLNHPLRVAAMVAREVPDVSEETLVVALLHNVLEVSKVSSSEIRNLFGESVALAVKALTIDRSRRDKSYLKEYYSRIETTSAGCATVKVADKLDNIYMICFNPSQDTRVSYLDEIDEWVIPLASRVVPQLVTRLEEASIVMRELGFLSRDADLEIARKDAIT